MIAYTAHYYGLSPMAVEDWYSDDIKKWYDEAVKLEIEKYKAIAEGLKGKKNE